MARRHYRKVVLDNGIRVVTEEIPSVKSISMGVWVEVGSRDEQDNESGISHFLEHMMFKGTVRRSAREIAQEIDGLGGELNAFTSRESTAYYTQVTEEHIPRALRLLSDLFYHSIFKPVEIEREKKVVLEEIKMVEDDPEDLIHELQMANVWKGNPISRSILGNVGTVRSFSRASIREYLGRRYVPERIVISVAGGFKSRQMIERIQRAFQSRGRSRRPLPMETRGVPVENGRRVFVRAKKLEQTHICIGLPGLSVTDQDRYSAFALNTLLGGGMSSRLFQEVREKRGLVYSIYSHLSGFRDTGMLSIYAATSPKSLRQVLKVIIGELQGLRSRGVGSEELKRAVNQMKGNIMLGLESTNNRMSRLARDELYFGRAFSLEETLDEIRKISKRQIKRLCDQLLDTQKLSLTVLGPSPPRISQLEKWMNG